MADSVVETLVDFKIKDALAAISVFELVTKEVTAVVGHIAVQKGITSILFV